MINGLANATPIEQQQLQALLDELIPKPPKTLGITHLATHKIDVQGHEPLKQRTRRYSQRILQAGWKDFERLLAEGIIEPSENRWSSCPVIVPKANGKYRSCVDYREINAIIKRDAYPMKNMDDILDKLCCARFISKLDLSEAYHQIALSPGSHEITAFSFPSRGLFQYTRLPYGLCNAPASFQKIMDRLIKPEWEPFV